MYDLLSLNQLVFCEANQMEVVNDNWTRQKIYVELNDMATEKSYNKIDRSSFFTLTICKHIGALVHRWVKCKCFPNTFKTFMPQPPYQYINILPHITLMLNVFIYQQRYN